MRTLILATILASASLSVHAAPLGSDAAELRGQYDLKDGSRLNITERRNTLYAQVNDGPVMALNATGPTTFTDHRGRLRIEFQQAANGSVSGVKLTRQQTLAESTSKNSY